MKFEKYMSSKVPLGLALLFVLNVAIVILIEVFCFYTLPRDLTPEILAQKNPRYENCTIVDMERNGKMICCLVQTESGDRELLTLRPHNYFLKRTRLLERQTVSIPAEETTTVNVKLGIHNVLVTVENGNDIAPFSLSVTGGKSIDTWYMVWGAVLELLELLAYHFCKDHL